MRGAISIRTQFRAEDFPPFADHDIRSGSCYPDQRRQRLSNFLLWQSAYAELVFTKCLWPDFDADTLQDAVSEYCQRERRYGAVG